MTSKQDVELSKYRLLFLIFRNLIVDFDKISFAKLLKYYEMLPEQGDDKNGKD